MNTEPLKILVIEDNACDAILLREALEVSARDARITLLTDGLEAVNHVRGMMESPALVPDVVVLDLKLPRVGGKELLSTMQVGDLLARVKVVVLTAFDEPGDREMAMSLGASAYIVKPMRLDDFLKIGRRIVAEARLPVEVARA